MTAMGYPKIPFFAKKMAADKDHFDNKFCAFSM